MFWAQLPLAAALAVGLTAQTAPALRLSPASATTGAAVTATGSGFQPSGSVALYVDAVVPGREVASAGLSEGSFSASFNAPREAGSYLVIACYAPDGSGGCRQIARAQLSVTARTPPPTPPPTPPAESAPTTAPPPSDQPTTTSPGSITTGPSSTSPTASATTSTSTTATTTVSSTEPSASDKSDNSARPVRDGDDAEDLDERNLAFTTSTHPPNETLAILVFFILLILGVARRLLGTGSTTRS